MNTNEEIKRQPDTGNRFAVAVAGKEILIMRVQQRLSKKDALNLAAWLIALADDNDEFSALLEAVQNT